VEAVIGIASFLIFLMFIERGLFTADENVYTYLAASIATRFPHFLDLSPFFMAVQLTQSSLALPSGFFYHNGEVHAAVYPGYPLLAAPFYLLLGETGMKVASSAVSSLIVVVTYRLGLLLTGHRDTALLAAVLALAAIPSLFYATSSWYHATSALFYLLALHSYLSCLRSESAVDAALTGLFTGLMLLTAPYTAVLILPPLLHLLHAAPQKIRYILIASLLVFSLPSVAYQQANFGNALTGKYSPSLEPLTRYSKPAWYVLGKEVTAYTLFRDLDRRYFYHFAQKSVFQSAPFLVLGLLLFLRRDGRYTAILTGVLASFVLFSYYYFDYGGMQFSMRYSYPAFPVLAALSAVAIRSLLGSSTVRRLALLLPAFFAAAALTAELWTISPNSTAYLHLKYFASATAAATAIAGVLCTGHRRYGNLLLALLVVGVFTGILNNINDTAVGNDHRRIHAEAVEEVSGLSAEVLLLPRAAPFDKIVLPGRYVLYYTPPPERDADWEAEMRELMEIAGEEGDRRIAAVLLRHDSTLLSRFASWRQIKNLSYTTDLFYSDAVAVEKP